MSEQIKDLISGSSHTANRSESSATRVIIVDDFTEGDAETRLAILSERYDKLYDPHPFYGNLEVAGKAVEALSPSQFKVTLQYAPKETTVSVGATLIETETTENITGDKLEVAPPPSKSTMQARVVPIKKLVPQITISFQKRLRRFAGDPSPLTLARQYQGTVNSSQFMGFAAGTVLCTRISGDSLDNGQTYLTQFEFLIDKKGWNSKPIYFPDQQGNAFPDAVEGQGMLTEIIYEEMEFSEMGLPDPENLGIPQNG